MGFRFIHSADWQLGRSFASVPGDAGARLREARFEAVRQLARLARDEAVDAVLVAGDVFDGHDVHRATIQRALGAMREFQGPWLLLPGNHDAALPGGVWARLLAERPVDTVRPVLEPLPLPLKSGIVVVLPAPLTERRTNDDLTAWMDAASSPAGAIRIGLAHGAVADRLPDKAEANNPIAHDRAARAGLDYLALGDWHGTLQIGTATWYAGTPEPDRWKANAAGQVLLVEIEAPGAPARVRTCLTGQFRWRELGLDCTGLAAGLETPAGALRRVMVRMDEPHREVIKLRLQGCIGLAHRVELEQEIKHLKDEVAWLEADLAELADEPGTADTHLLDDAGIVGTVASRLRAQASGGPAAATAALALRLLFAQTLPRKAGG